MKLGVSEPWARAGMSGEDSRGRQTREETRGKAGNRRKQQGTNEEMTRRGRQWGEKATRGRQVNSLGTVRLFWGSYIHIYYLYMYSL